MSLANILSKAEQVVNKVSKELKTPQGKVLSTNGAFIAATAGMYVLGHKAKPETYTFNKCVTGMALVAGIALIDLYAAKKYNENKF